MEVGTGEALLVECHALVCQSQVQASLWVNFPSIFAISVMKWHCKLNGQESLPFILLA